MRYNLTDQFTEVSYDHGTIHNLSRNISVEISNDGNGGIILAPQEKFQWNGGSPKARAIGGSAKIAVVPFSDSAGGSGGSGSGNNSGNGGNSGSSSGSGFGVADVTNSSAVPSNGKVSLTWTDPDDLVYNGVTLSNWAGTKVVRKAGSAPSSVEDGTVVVDSTTKNAYASTPYEDTGLTNGTTYYYRFFTYSTSGVYTVGTSVNVEPNAYDPNLSVSSSSVSISSGTQTVTVTSSSSGAISVVSSDNTVVTASASGSTVTITFVGAGSATITVSQVADGDYRAGSATISVTATAGLRYGYRISKTESDPSTRVEYLYDAVGMTPAAMDFANGEFDYGSWENAWFVTGNKPCMLKSDGTVDYYLNPNDYSKKEDGTESDVANTSYDGNAMASIPLVWVYRYEDEDYCYEIISNVQYDSNYKAYAHTRADGSIADVFYHSMFRASGDATKLRSLSGQSNAGSLTTTNQVNGASANGSGWYITTWSQRELIRTLLILMGKSTNVQAVYGNGWLNGNALTSGTGTLNDKGQFCGYSDATHQVKVFHIEGFWGDQWTRTAGYINSGGKIYVKMTPEGQGYNTTDVVTGYTDTGVTVPSGQSSYISSVQCCEYGMIPTAISGSGSTYYTDGYWANNGFGYLLAGSSQDMDNTLAGVFTNNTNDGGGAAYASFGCALSYEQSV